MKRHFLKPRPSLANSSMPDLMSLVISIAIFAVASLIIPAITFAQSKVIVEGSPLDFYSPRTGLTPKAKDTVVPTQTSSQTLSDLLNTTGLIQARTTGSPTYSIRGSGSAARTLLLYDGTPLNMSDGFGANPLFLPIENISEIRILRGPSSLFYGADALGGAIEFLPRKYDRWTARVSTASFGQKNILLAAPLKAPTQKEYLQLSVFTDINERNYDYQVPRLNVSGQRDFNNNRILRTTLSGQHETPAGQISEKLIYAEEQGRTPGPINFISPSDFNNKAFLGSVSLQRDLSSLWSIRSQLHHQLLHNEYFNDQFAGFPPFSVNQSSRTGLLTAANYRGIQNVLLEPFVDLAWHDFKTSSSTMRSLNRQDFESGMLAQWQVDDDLTFQPGVRYLSQFGQWIQGYGFYQDHPQHWTWITYSQGYRNPSLTQTHSAYPNYLPNPQLKPEFSHQLEIGFKNKRDLNLTSLDLQLGYQFSAFSNEYSDYHVTRVVTSGSTSATQWTNDGRAFSQGFEFTGSVSYDLWKFLANYAYLKTENEKTRQPLILSPENTVAGTLQYRWAFLVFELKDTYWSKSYDLNLAGSMTELPEWNIVDFALRTFALERWTIEMNVQNIFDRPRELTLNYPEPQRRYGVSLEHRF